MASVAPQPAVQARDQAFERLYERYVGDVYRYALALLRNPTDAEDVTQTTFMNAYRAFKRGDEIQKPHNWLIKIVHNVARSRYAHASRRVQEVPLEDHIEQLAVLEDDKPNLDTVLRALGRLPFNQRAALVMRELEGRTYAEIADTLGVSVSAVETLIFRARKSLRVKTSELRILTGVPLPGSLAPIFQAGGAVTGGGVGGGAIAGAGVVGKALVALAVGVVATGVGGDKSGPATAADADGPRVFVSAPADSASPSASTKRSDLRYAKGRRGAKQLIVGGRALGPRLGNDDPLGAAPTAANGAAVNGAATHGTAATAPTAVVSSAASGAAPSPHESVPGVQVPSVVTLPQAPPVQEAVTNVTQNVVETVTTVVPVAPPKVPGNVPAIPPVTPPAVPSVPTPPVQVPPVQVPTLPPVPPLPRLP
jgi:RNA polymerase sigma factor (sigma-70 family)